MATEILPSSEQGEWYALFVMTGAEHVVKHKLMKLELEGLNFHVPSREMRIRSAGKWISDLKPMFPGYILAAGEMTDSSYTKVRQLTDVYSWISDENGPLRIQPQEVSLICRLMDAEDVVRISRVVYEGQRITVVDGPLKGQEAIIRRVDRRKGRVKIAMSVFGAEKLVDIAVEDVDSAGE